MLVALQHAGAWATDGHPVDFLVVEAEQLLAAEVGGAPRHRRRQAAAADLHACPRVDVGLRAHRRVTPDAQRALAAIPQPQDDPGLFEAEALVVDALQRRLGLDLDQTVDQAVDGGGVGVGLHGARQAPPALVPRERDGAAGALDVHAVDRRRVELWEDARVDRGVVVGLLGGRLHQRQQADERQQNGGEDDENAGLSVLQERSHDSMTASPPTTRGSHGAQGSG